MQTWRQLYRDRIAPIEGWISRIRLYIWLIAAFIAAITMMIGFAQQIPPYWVIPAALAAFVLVLLIVYQLGGIRKTRRTHPRRIPLFEFCRRAKKIINLDIDDGKTEILEFAGALRQAGADGTIQFYGNELPDGPISSLKFSAKTRVLSKISPSLFKEYSFEVLEMMRTGDNLTSRLYSLGRNKLSYSNLHLEEREAESWLYRDSRREVDYFKSLRE